MRTRVDVAFGAADVGNGSVQDALVHYPAVSTLFRRPVPTTLSRSDSGTITANADAIHAWRSPRLVWGDRLAGGSRTSLLSRAETPWSKPSHSVGIFGQTGPRRNTNNMQGAPDVNGPRLFPSGCARPTSCSELAPRLERRADAGLRGLPTECRGHPLDVPPSLGLIPFWAKDAKIGSSGRIPGLMRHG